MIDIVWMNSLVIILTSPLTSALILNSDERFSLYSPYVFQPFNQPDYMIRVKMNLMIYLTL